MQARKYISLKVTGIKEEAEGVKSFSLATLYGENLPYKAGQFISFAFHIGGKEERRSYSFVSSPLCGEQMQVTVRRIENGIFSRILFDKIKPGDVLHSTGVSGFFTLPEAHGPLFFFAAGIGITPVFSMIKEALAARSAEKIVLFYSNHAAGRAVFREELNLLKMQYPGTFYIVYLYSLSPDLSRARLNKELIPILLKEYNAGPGAYYYICGPYAYMRMVTYALEEMEVPPAHIRKENFDTTVTLNRPAPPDKKPHTVYLHFGNEQYSFVSAYPDTILQAAEKNGISLPYSCRNGVCGTCAARCVSGKVWHSANEVLTDKELQSGLMLTCVAYPVEGDVEVEVLQ